jgi:hypothetical protein
VSSSVPALIQARSHDTSGLYVREIWRGTRGVNVQLDLSYAGSGAS